MTINEIRESGLLELYVLGTLEGKELSTVEKAIKQYPELKADLNSIERSLQSYAKAHEVAPSPGLKDRIIQEAKKSKNTPNKKNGGSNNGLFYSLLALLTVSAAAFAYMWNSTNQEMTQLQQDYADQIEECDSIRQQSELQYALQQDITSPNNTIIGVTETPKYAETEIYLYHNPTDKKNYLQLKSLPPIDNNTQSYQLWSIKGTDPPTPLDVFQGDVTVLNVQHVDATEVYAITIEPKGGLQSPTLADLIGTFAI